MVEDITQIGKLRSIQVYFSSEEPINPMTQYHAPSTDSDLLLRPVRWDDLDAIARLIYEVCEADGDTTVAVTPEDLANSWKHEGFNPELDAWLVNTRAGQLVGYAELLDVKDHFHLSGDLYVHPKYPGQAVHTALLREIEKRGMHHVRLAPPGSRVFIRAATDHRDETGITCYNREGYAAVRYFWRMGIELESPPPLPSLPAGLAFRPFVKDEQAQAIWQARNESFQEHWGSHPISFEEFSYYYFDAPEYDPSLWMVIWKADEIAGFSINHYRMGIGWIRTLGVRPAWRQHSLGLSLLQQSFAEFYRRETTTIGLGVDASNPTGATRLYQKAGMQVVSQFVNMEKELRPGSVQTETLA